MEKESQTLREMVRSHAYPVLAGLSTASILLIAVSIIPIANQATSWNNCLNTTESFLSTVPGLKSVDAAGIEAMSVNLCNGATPQKAER